MCWIGDQGLSRFGVLTVKRVCLKTGKKTKTTGVLREVQFAGDKNGAKILIAYAHA
jgi:hypothetical protein